MEYGLYFCFMAATWAVYIVWFIVKCNLLLFSVLISLPAAAKVNSDNMFDPMMNADSSTTTAGQVARRVQNVHVWLQRDEKDNTKIAFHTKPRVGSSSR